jgi:hypothetical protein
MVGFSGASNAKAALLTAAIEVLLNRITSQFDAKNPIFLQAVIVRDMLLGHKKVESFVDSVGILLDRIYNSMEQVSDHQKIKSPVFRQAAIVQDMMHRLANGEEYIVTNDQG